MDDDKAVSIFIVPVSHPVGQPFTTEVAEGNGWFTSTSFWFIEDR